MAPRVKIKRKDGKGWWQISPYHDDLLDMQGGLEGESYHLSEVEYIELTSGETSLHTHDTRYYTETEVDTALGLKADDAEVLKKDGSVSLTADWDAGAFTISAIGLILDQGNNDDKILALRSSDVVHNYLTGANTNTYFLMQKSSPILGGAWLMYLMEDTGNVVAYHEVIGGLGETTKSISGRSLFEIDLKAHDGANSLVDIIANTNIFGVRARRSGSAETVFILDTNGHTWQDGVITADSAILGSMKSGATQTAAGAAAGELWYTVGHTSLPDYVVMMGV